MTVTITPQNGTSILRFEVTADTAKITAVATDAARYVYPIRWQLYAGQTPRPWDDLTTLEKLAVLDQELKFNLKQMARSFHVNDARDAAAAAAEDEADALYDI